MEKKVLTHISYIVVQVMHIHSTKIGFTFDKAIYLRNERKKNNMLTYTRGKENAFDRCFEESVFCTYYVVHYCQWVDKKWSEEKEMNGLIERY